MSERKLMVLDKYGWPVVRIKGRPITNLIRYLLHGRKIGRWPKGDIPNWTDDGSVQTGPPAP